jgi:hypothetical protein
MLAPGGPVRNPLSFVGPADQQAATVVIAVAITVADVVVAAAGT